MSQPLFGALGRKVAVEPSPERGPQLATNQQVTTQRVLSLREAVALLMILACLVLVPVGFGIALGIGAALISLGVLVGALGVTMAVV